MVHRSYQLRLFLSKTKGEDTFVPQIVKHILVSPFLQTSNPLTARLHLPTSLQLPPLVTHHVATTEGLHGHKTVRRTWIGLNWIEFVCVDSALTRYTFAARAERGRSHKARHRGTFMLVSDFGVTLCVFTLKCRQCWYLCRWIRVTRHPVENVHFCAKM